MITKKNGGQAQWWDVKVVGVTSQMEWNTIDAHKSSPSLDQQVKNGLTTPIISTNLFLFFGVK